MERRSGARAGGLAARTVAAVTALVWAVPFFGLIDLLVVPTQDHEFYLHYLLETGWGLLYTALVALPLLMFAARPDRVLLQQLAVVGAAVLLGALLAPAPWQVVPGVLLVLNAWGLSALARGGRQRRLTSTGPDPWTGVLALVAVAGAAAYAVELLRGHTSGLLDEETWGLMHLPMQASFALGLAGSACVTALAAGAGARGWRWSAWPAGIAAAWIGVVSVAYPRHMGSLGPVAGIAAVAWGVLFVGAAMLRRRRPTAVASAVAPGDA